MFVGEGHEYPFYVFKFDMENKLTSLHTDMMNAVRQNKTKLETIGQTFIKDISNYLSGQNAVAKHINIEVEQTSSTNRNIFFAFPDFSKRIQLHDRFTWLGGNNLDLVFSFTNPNNGSLIVSFTIDTQGETIVNYPGEEPCNLGTKLQHGYDAFLSCIVSGCLKANLFQ